MYHQFKQLAGIDITKESMEVGPTTHYVMGGVRVDPDTQMSCVPGLFAAGECAGGLHGANRLGVNSLSDLLVVGNRAGEHAAADRPLPPPGLARRQRPWCRPSSRGAVTRRLLLPPSVLHLALLHYEGETKACHY